MLSNYPSQIRPIVNLDQSTVISIQENAFKMSSIKCQPSYADLNMFTFEAKQQINIDKLIQFQIYLQQNVIFRGVFFLHFYDFP